MEQKFELFCLEKSFKLIYVEEKFGSKSSNYSIEESWCNFGFVVVVLVLRYLFLYLFPQRNYGQTIQVNLCVNKGRKTTECSSLVGGGKTITVMVPEGKK